MPDGHHVVIDGRTWRATDPELPEEVAAQLRKQLMAARRAVGVALRAKDVDGERVARAGVQRAKTALGERGTPWWEQTAEQRRARWEAGLDSSSWSPPRATGPGHDRPHARPAPRTTGAPRTSTWRRSQDC